MLAINEVQLGCVANAAQLWKQFCGCLYMCDESSKYNPGAPSSIFCLQEVLTGHKF